MKTLAAPDRSRDRRWAFVRLLLGLAQCFGAVFSAVLLFESGVTAVSLTAVVATGLCTTVSVMLFGSRPEGKK